MFLYNVFYSSLFLIFYFDRKIIYCECSLLSRAKNPIIIGVEPQTSAKETYQYELLLQTIEPDKYEDFFVSKSLKSKQYTSLTNNISTNVYKPSTRVTNNQSRLISTTTKINKSKYDTNTSSILSDQYELFVHPQHLSKHHVATFNDINYYWRVPGVLVNKNEPPRTNSKPHGPLTTRDKFVGFETRSFSALPPEVYHFEPIGTSPSPENVYKYEPIHFSALYLDEPNWRKESTGKIKINSENVITYAAANDEKLSKSSLVTEYVEPRMSSEIADFNEGKVLTPIIDKMYLDGPVIDDFLEAPRGVRDPYNYVRTPVLFFFTTSSRTRKMLIKFTAVLNTTTKELYENSISDKVAEKLMTHRNVKEITPLEEPIIPFVTDKSFNSYRSPPLIEDPRSTRATPDYWNHFWQLETRKSPTKVSKTYQLETAPTTTEVKEYRQFELMKTRKTVAEVPITYQLVPATSTKETAEYWNDFRQTKSTRKFQFLKTLDGNVIYDKDYAEESSRGTIDLGQSSELFDDHRREEDIFITSPTRPVLPDILRLFGNTKDRSLTTRTHLKGGKGYKTLWKPTTIPTRSKPSFVDNRKPTRSTTVHWNFNDNDAAWPKVQLKFLSTKNVTKPTKPRKTFHTYFPFYHSRNDWQIARTPMNVQTTSENYLEEELGKKLSGSRALRSTDRCYECGLDVEEIPYYPSCYHNFNGMDQRSRYKKKKYRKKCQKSYGCFKRIVELGEVYNERGCREFPPRAGKSFASHRLARLERALKSIDEGCITSPHASLTPFSKAISLFAKYHACVCNTRYCNAAQRFEVSVYIVLWNIFVSI